MSPTLNEQIAQLKHTIAEMESQRDSLGDEVVDASLALLRWKLEPLSALLEIPRESLPETTQQQRKQVTFDGVEILKNASEI